MGDGVAASASWAIAVAVVLNPKGSLVTVGGGTPSGELICVDTGVAPMGVLVAVTPGTGVANGLSPMGVGDADPGGTRVTGVTSVGGGWKPAGGVTTTGVMEPEKATSVPLIAGVGVTPGPYPHISCCSPGIPSVVTSSNRKQYCSP